MTGPDVAEQETLAWDALRGAVDHDGNRLDRAMNRLAEGGVPVMFNACCGFASVIHALQPPSGDYLGVAAVNVRTGESISVDETGAAPHVIAALRFIAAVGNDDFDTALAVFAAACDAGDGMNTVALVLAATATAVRNNENAR